MSNQSGIYSITHKKSGKRYIGSAMNIRGRWNMHRHRLRQGTHHSPHLQAAWDKYGEAAFVFEILATCEPSELTAQEQFWIDAFHTCSNRYGYNTLPNAANWLGMKHTEASKKAMSFKRKGKPLTPTQRAALVGRKYSMSESGKMARRGENNSRAILTEADVVSIKARLRDGQSVKDVSLTFGVSYHVIWEIAIGHRWTHVEVDGFVPGRRGPGVGENNAMAKLTADKVAEIKRLLREGMMGKDVARIYGISKQAVSKIKMGKIWSHVE